MRAEKGPLSEGSPSPGALGNWREGGGVEGRAGAGAMLAEALGAAGFSCRVPLRAVQRALTRQLPRELRAHGELQSQGWTGPES